MLGNNHAPPSNTINTINTGATIARNHLNSATLGLAPVTNFKK